MDRRWGLAILAVGGIYLWSKREEVAAAIQPGLTLAVTPGQAEAILAEPSKAAAALDSYVAAHPTSFSVLEQAKARIADGTAEPEDIVRLSADLRAYNEYVQDGGGGSFEDFTITNYSSMPEKYKSIIDDAKAATVRARADEVEATGQHTLEYKLATLSHTNPLWQELAARHPELVTKEDAAAVATGEPIPAKDVVAAVVNETTVPDGFTATQKQLDELVAAGVTKETDVYQEALDIAYVKAASQCNDGDVVSYSDDGGYEAKSSSEIAEEAAAAYVPPAPKPAPVKVPAPYVPPEKVVAAVEQSTVPEGFTASGGQLDSLETAGVTKDTEVYKEAVDLAYVEAASQCKEGDVVAWSSDGGYEAKSSSEIAEEAAAAYVPPAPKPEPVSYEVYKTDWISARARAQAAWVPPTYYAPKPRSYYAPKPAYVPSVPKPAPSVSPEKVVAAVEQSTVPEGFTASGGQLDALEGAGITKDTEVYKEAVDLAYVEAAKECTEDKVVTWSSDGGYEAKSSSEIAEEAAASGAEAWTYYT